MLIKKIAVALFAATALLALTSTHQADAASRSDCTAIVAAMRAQGASPAVAARFGQIAWRESGCSMQCVSDRDDYSCSRYGINFKWRGASAGWGRLCGAYSREATRNLTTDTRCAYRAYRAMGWKPWRTH